MCQVSCVLCHVSYVMCHKSCVMCHVYCVTCCVSHVTCQLSLTTKATATDPPHDNSAILPNRLVCKKPKKHKNYLKL